MGDLHSENEKKDPDEAFSDENTEVVEEEITEGLQLYPYIWNLHNPCMGYLCQTLASLASNHDKLLNVKTQNQMINSI